MKNNRKLLWVIAFLVIAGGAFAFVVQQKSKQGDVTSESLVVSSEDAENTNDENSTSGIIDVQAALSERVLGDPEAPVRISEHSSFTCGHCGSFHRNTYMDFKSGYLDSGKAYLVFSDFPLNGPALYASMVTRCAPHDRYFDFVQYLFKTQETWAYDSKYIDHLQTAALKYGVNEETFKACVNNEELRKGIAERMRASQQQWKINSTPSFVVNNKTVISGDMPYETFSLKIEEAVTGKVLTPPEPEIQEEIETDIDNAIEETEDAGEDALESLEEKMEQAEEEIEEITENAQDDLERVKDTETLEESAEAEADIMNNAKSEIEEVVEETETAIEAEVQETQEEVQETQDEVDEGSVEEPSSEETTTSTSSGSSHGITTVRPQ